MPTLHKASEAALAYFGGDALAASAWVDKYALRDAEGRLLERDPDAMHARLALEFARAEAAYPPLPAEKRALLSELGQRLGILDYDRILALLAGFRKVVPQGSVMAGLGDAHHLASLSNCVVLPPPVDSYGGILRTDEQLAQLCKRRCGVGFDLSTLRPAGMPVHNAARTSTGATGFMERYSSTVREVAQKGRRGALMLTMDVRHPDIIAFIESKQDLTRVTGANISVRVSDAFMQAVEADAEWELRWPVEEEAPRMRRTVKARAIWDRLVACAHSTAEPGVLFWDRQHRYSTSSVYPGFRNAGTNPCGEIAMQGGDSCRLMALNLMGFVREPFTAAARFDHEAFAEAAYLAQRLMDDLVDLELETIDRILAKIDADPEPETVKRVERELWRSLRDNGASGRRTGLGITALADALAALGHRYGDADSLAATGSIMRTKCRAEFECSIDLAIERGAFAVFDPAVESESEFVRMLRDEFPDVHARMMRYGRRNISLSTVAPTGTLSLLTRTSSGMEPVFALRHTRRRRIATDHAGGEEAWEEYDVLHPGLRLWMELTGGHPSQAGPYAGATASELDPTERLRMQAVVQRYTTHSISSTLNLAADTTATTIDAIYKEAWRMGLKGVTVFREGSREGVLTRSEQDASAAAGQLCSVSEFPCA